MGLGEFFELTSIQGASFLPRLLLPSVRSLVGAYVVVALVYSLVVVVVVSDLGQQPRAPFAENSEILFKRSLS